jgi:hypothetical protein
MDRTRLISRWVAAVAACAILTIAPAIARAEESPPLFYANGKRVTAMPVPVLANGRIKLVGPLLGEAFCLNTFSLNVWNEHEHGEAINPERGYGEVTDWRTSLCEGTLVGESLEVGRPKLTPAVSAEMPLEKEFREAEVCANEFKTKLSECPNPSERESARVISAARRRPLNLPWKLELVRGKRGEREGVLMKIGLHEFGEAGQATTQNTGCFPKEKFVNPETAKEEERPANYTAIPSGCVGLNVYAPQYAFEYALYGTLEDFTLNGFANGLRPSRLEFIEPGKLFSSEGAEGEGETTGELHLFGSRAVELINAR